MNLIELEAEYGNQMRGDCNSFEEGSKSTKPSIDTMCRPVINFLFIIISFLTHAKQIRLSVVKYFHTGRPIEKSPVYYFIFISITQHKPKPKAINRLVFSYRQINRIIFYFYYCYLFFFFIHQPSQMR